MASPSRLPARRPADSGRSRPMSMIEGPMLDLKLPPTSNGTTLKQAKRRSLLPQFARKASGQQRAGIEEEDGEENGETASVSDTISEEPRKAFEDAERKATPTPRKQARPTSTYGIGGIGRGQALKPYLEPLRNEDDTQAARADSLAALEGASAAASVASTSRALESGIKRNASTRLPQSHGLGGLSRTISVTSKDTHSRKSSTSTSTSGRPSSINGPESGRGSAPTKQPTSPKASQTAQTTRRTQMLPPPKPAFSTYQQHYSPAKSALPKPPIPPARTTSIKRATQADEVDISTDVARLQIELLQLSLMHQASFKTMREFEASAYRKLGRKHARLKKEDEAIRAIETEQQRLTNIVALEMWCPDPALLVECLQGLSRVYAEVTALIEAGSRYTELVSGFESWVRDAEEASEGTRTGFVEPLSEDWRSMHASLALKFRSLQRDISVLPPTPGNGDNGNRSSLAILLGSCTSLLDGMVRELDLMTKLEREVLSHEKTRIDDELKAVTRDTTALEAFMTDKEPAWQSVA